jgi:hypothetical protein
MSLEDKTGPGMPGGSDEQFAHGQDYRGVNPDMAALPQGGVNIGVLGGAGEAKGPDFDAMQGLTSDGSPLFNDGPHGADAGGFDAMRGLADGQQQVEVLANEQMYSSQAVPGFSPLPETANPLVGGGEAQGDSINTRE